MRSELTVRGVPIARLAGVAPSPTVLPTPTTRTEGDTRTRISWAQTVGRAVTVCALSAAIICGTQPEYISQYQAHGLHLHGTDCQFGPIPTRTRTDGLIELTANPVQTAAYFGFTVASGEYNPTDDAAFLVASGRPHGDILESLSSSERATDGTVHLAPNPKASAAINTAISELNTRGRVIHAIKRALRQWNIRALEPGSIANQLSAVRNWEPFIREVFLVSPYRLVWGTDMDAATRRREENYLMAFMAIMDKRCTTFGTVDNMLSHIRQFHLTVLDIAVPEFHTIFPRLTNCRAKGRIRDKKRPKGRRRRPTFKTQQILQMCNRLIGVITNSRARPTIRHDACVLLCIICGGFTLLFRIGELAKGTGFDPRRHWTVGWLRVLCSLADKQIRCILQPARKVESEQSREAMPIIMRPHPINFAWAIQRLFALRASLGMIIGDDNDVFATFDGSSSTTD